MTVYDSSFLIDYLAGDPDTVAYAEDHADEAAIAPNLVLYEVHLGELYTEGDPDFGAVADALEWVTILPPGGPQFGRRAAELTGRLMDAGSPLGFRDGYVAAAAWSLDDRLVTRDSDFDAPAVREEIDVEIV